MRTNRLVAATSVFLMGLATPALADDVSGVYDVKFEEMSTNCSPPPVTYTRGTVKIEAKKSLTVNIETIPIMTGVPAKSGKINAKTTKKLASTVQGLDGKWGVSGRVDENGVLQLVLVAEYTRQDNGKPHCTQSWNVSGVRQSASAKAPADDKKPKAKAAIDAFLPSLLD